MLSILKKDDGYTAVFLVITVLVLLSTILTGLVGLSVTSYSLAKTKTLQANVLYIAESGVNYALIKAVDPAWRPDGSAQIDVEPDKSYFKVEVRDTADDKIMITSTGFVKDINNKWIERKIRVYAEKDIAGAFQFALFSNSDTAMSGNSKIYNGDMHVNGSATLSGNPQIDGKLDVTGSVSKSGNPNVTDGIYSGSQQVDMPAIDSNSYLAKAQALGTTNGDVSISGNNPVTLKGYINGNLSISGNAPITIDEIVYVAGSVSISGNIKVSGNGAIIANSNISVSGNIEYLAGSVGKLAFISLASGSGAISISGNPSIDGLIYAPSGTINISGNPDILGGLVANGVSLSGNPTITRDPQIDTLVNILPGNLLKVVLWERM